MNRSLRQKVLVVVVTAVAPLSLAACGSSSDSETSASLSKAQVLKKGNEICAKRVEEKDKAVKATLKSFPSSAIAKPSKQNLEELGESLLPPYKQLASELAELSATANNGAPLDDVVSKLEAGLDKAEANPGSLASSNPFEDAADAAKAYGLQTCIF